MKSSALGLAKVYFSASDFGKMLKLKDVSNLVITDVEVDRTMSDVEITVVTPMDNSSSRVISKDGFSHTRIYGGANSYVHSDTSDKEDNECEKMYIDFGRDFTIIYFKERVTKINSPKIKTVVKEISRLSDSNKAIRICGDFHMAISLIDELRNEGFNNIADTNLSFVDESKGTNYFINEKN